MHRGQAAVEAQQLAVVQAGVAGQPGRAAGQAQADPGVLDQDRRPLGVRLAGGLQGLVDQRLQGGRSAAAAPGGWPGC
jgi:hypothetical protein